MNKRIFFLLVVSVFILSSGVPEHVNGAVKPANNLGIVGWWPLNEGTSTVAHDISGYSNNGTLTNMDASTDWISGKRGKALDFDGSNDHIPVGNGSTLNITGPLTVSAWVYFSSLASETIVSKWGLDDNSNFSWLLFANHFGSGRVDFLVSGNGTGYVSVNTGNGYVRTGQWYHIVGVYDTTTTKMYVDGNLIATNSTSIPSSLKSVTVPVTIGADYDRPDNNETFYRPFNGKIDDVRIYNRALTATDVSALARAGQVARNTISHNGLVGWWTFDEGTSTTAHDFSGQGNIGSLSGTGGPTWVAGERGKALFFAGNDTNNNQTVTITAGATNPELAILGDVTVSAWVKPSSSYVDGNQAVVRGGQGTDLDYSIFFNPAVQGPYFHWYDGSTFPTVAGTSNSVPFDRWSHVTITRSGTTVSFYVNGVFTNSATVTLPPVSAAQIAIGRTANVGVPQDYSGAIDDVRIYNRALSSAEISDLYRQNQTEVGGSQETSVSSGLVGYWSLNGKDISWQQNRAFDLSGNNNYGTLFNLGTTTAPTRGRVGQALNFDADSKYVSSINTTGLTGDVTVTVSAWIYVTNNTNAFQMIIGQANADVQRQCINFILRSGKLSLDFCTGGYTQSATLATNRWYHVAAVKTPGLLSATTKLYVDGVDVTSGGSVLGGGDGTPNVTNSIITIGRFAPLGQHGFRGIIDEARLYNRALSAEEIRRLYLLGK